MWLSDQDLYSLSPAVRRAKEAWLDAVEDHSLWRDLAAYQPNCREYLANAEKASAEYEEAQAAYENALDRAFDRYTAEPDPWSHRQMDADAEFSLHLSRIAAPDPEVQPEPEAGI